MYIDHLTVAALVGSLLQKNEDIANVTNVQVVGERNPKASFTVIGENGAVLQFEIKRLMRGQAQEPPPLTDKPKARKPAAKRKVSKK